MVSKRQSRRRRAEGKTKSGEWPERMRVAEARKYLGVSAAKITALISAGILPFERDMLDNRVKLIRRSDLEALLKEHEER